MARLQGDPDFEPRTFSDMLSGHKWPAPAVKTARTFGLPTGEIPTPDRQQKTPAG